MVQETKAPVTSEFKVLACFHLLLEGRKWISAGCIWRGLERARWLDGDSGRLRMDTMNPPPLTPLNPLLMQPALPNLVAGAPLWEGTHSLVVKHLL